MCLEGLAQYEKDKVLTEIPPEKDEKGEVTEVQVLEERETPSMNTLRCPHLIPMTSWRNSTSINPKVTSINALDAK